MSSNSAVDGDSPGKQSAVAEKPAATTRLESTWLNWRRGRPQNEVMDTLVIGPYTGNKLQVAVNHQRGSQMICSNFSNLSEICSDLRALGPSSEFASALADITTFLLVQHESMQECVSDLVDILIDVLPNLCDFEAFCEPDLDGVLFLQTCTHFLNHKKIAMQLQKVTMFMNTFDITGAEDIFQAWTDALQNCPKLSSFECRLGNDVERDDVEDHPRWDDDSWSGNDSSTGDDTGDDEWPLGGSESDENESNPDTGDNVPPPPVSISQVGLRVYHTKRPQDFNINIHWDRVVKNLAIGSQHSLKNIRIVAPTKWNIDTLLSPETTQALLHLKERTMPMCLYREQLNRYPHISFPFTLNLADSETSMEAVVDYLIRVHVEDGVVTHFIAENPLARSNNNSDRSDNEQSTFMQSLIHRYGLELPSFRFMYNGVEDPGRRNDIFVILGANLVYPSRIKARLIERLQTPDTPVLVAEELLHEPKHYLFYQGIQKHDLWHFDPSTATDRQFLNMLAVMANLGPHGSFFHKSVDYGLVMRHNLLSQYRERLVRWVDGTHAKE